MHCWLVLFITQMLRRREIRAAARRHRLGRRPQPPHVRRLRAVRQRRAVRFLHAVLHPRRRRVPQRLDAPRSVAHRPQVPVGLGLRLHAVRLRVRAQHKRLFPQEPRSRPQMKTLWSAKNAVKNTMGVWIRSVCWITPVVGVVFAVTETLN